MPHKMQKNAENSPAQSRLLQLFTAVKNENADEVRILIDQLGGYVNRKLIHRFPDADGLTPLHKAALTGNVEILKLFIKTKNVYLNVKDKYGWTAMNYVFERNDINAARILIDAGAKYKSESALYLAVDENDNSFAEYLIARGANVNDLTYGKTPLHTAAYRNHASSHLAVIKVLLNNGADVNIRDEKGRSPVVILLFKHSYDTVYHSGKKPLLYLLNCSDGHSIEQLVVFLLGVNTKEEDNWKIALKHIAKLQTLNLLVNQPNIVNLIQRRSNFRDYFSKCVQELTVAKSTKLKNCWVTYFNLLTDDKKKLKNYAGNAELIEEFEKSDCIKNYPIYGSGMQKRMNRGIQKRKLFDESSVELSNCLPIINPNHLITRDIFDCLTTQDLSKFCELYSK